MPLGSGKDQQAEGPRAFSQRRAKPPVGCSSPGRRQSRSLHQQSHPTRVVAGVDILRHTSAHKGSPLFRRRAPAPNTVDPRGLLTARHEAIGQTSGDLSSSTGASRSMESRQTQFVEERPSRLAGPSQGSETRTPLQKEACAGESRGVREVGLAVRKRPAWRRDSSSSGRLTGSPLLARPTALACRAIDRQRSRAVRVPAA